MRIGFILYNDPVSDYVNGVMEEIIKSNPKLKRKNPRVYNRYRYIFFEVGYQQFSSRQSALLRFAEQPSLKYRISTQSVGIGLYKTSKRKSRSLSPLGFFFGYKVNYSRSTATPIKYADTKEKFEGVEKAAYNLIYDRPELNFLGLAVSSGFRTVLKDKFTLSYAFDFGFDLPLGEYDSNEPQFAFSRKDLQRNNSLYLYLTIGGGMLLY